MHTDYNTIPILRFLHPIIMLVCLAGCSDLMRGEIHVITPNSPLVEAGIRIDEATLRYSSNQDIHTIEIEDPGKKQIIRGLSTPQTPLILSYTEYVNTIPIMNGSAILFETQMSFFTGHTRVDIDIGLGKLGEILLSLVEQGIAIERIDLRRLIEYVRDEGKNGPLILDVPGLSEALSYNTMHTRIIRKPKHQILVPSDEEFTFVQGYAWSDEITLSPGIYYVYTMRKKDAQDVPINSEKPSLPLSQTPFVYELSVSEAGRYSLVPMKYY